MTGSTDEHVRIPLWLRSVAVWVITLAAAGAAWWIKGLADDVHADHANVAAMVGQVSDVHERVARIEAIFLNRSISHDAGSGATASASGCGPKGCGDAGLIAWAMAHRFGLVGDASAAESESASVARHGVHGRPDSAPSDGERRQH